jgi:hypothetical protein
LACRLPLAFNGLRCVRIATPTACWLDWLRRVPVDWGQAGLSLEKADDPTTVYHVHLDEPRSTCQCMGSLRWGHCKHVDSLAALVEGSAL